MSKQELQQNIETTFKSRDTEEWLDIHFTRPIGYWWAKLFEKLGVAPNVITVASMVLGAAAGVMFYFTDLWCNIVGVLLLMWANFYDSADGQLARMTGKTTEWGRILDGFAGDVWFFFIYFALAFRMYSQNIPGTAQTWGLWAFAIFALSGFVFHSKQSQLADYYRTIHLWTLPGSKTQIQESTQVHEEYKKASWLRQPLWTLSIWGYVDYARTQEHMTPNCQRMLRYLRCETEVFSNPEADETKAFKAQLRELGRPLMKYCNILTFNCRAIALYIACLLNMPWLYAAFEIIVLTIVFFLLRHRHEAICKSLTPNL